jgi:GNAT superfamily N-acetyltransferase
MSAHCVRLDLSNRGDMETFQRIQYRGHQLTPEADGEQGPIWLAYLRQVAREAPPLGVYAMVDQQRHPLAVAALTEDQHGAGGLYGVPGPWLAAAHVFAPYRRSGLHRHLIGSRLDALRQAGIEAANVAVFTTNRRSMINLLQAGFQPVGLGPDLDPEGSRSDTAVFMHLPLPAASTEFAHAAPRQ